MDKKLENFDANWETPDINELGNAKDLVKAVNFVSGGDAQFSVLLPS
tara:strand:- start:113 stop:253 length:141 start_codon:yes stop_codon:yes gene_type:complete